MKRISKWIVKFRIPIIVVCFLLLIPSAIGMANVRVNYDMLDYLPDDIETVEGQQILLDEFGKGAFSFIIVEDKNTKDINNLKDEISKVDHVAEVVWYTSFADTSIPAEILPEDIYNIFNKEDATILAVFFDSSVSSDDTMGAIKEIKGICDEGVYVSGMSAFVTELKDLAEKEEPIYVTIAVVLCLAVLAIFMDSLLLPIVFIISIGISILINLGSNIFLGEISYITKALSAVLQLAVTTDYSIFLWNSYKEAKTKFNNNNDAMAEAITQTASSVFGSSITTVVGFIALCFMSFTLGRDLGIVMAKGVILGVIGCITFLPSAILILDKPITKSMHKPLIPKLKKSGDWLANHSYLFLIVYLLILIPAFYGYKNTDVYYNLFDTLPKDMECVVANTKLSEEFDLNSTHIILVDANLPSKDAANLENKLGEVQGVEFVLGLDEIVGPMVPEDSIPDSIKEIFKSDKYQMILVGSKYATASDEVNKQIDVLNIVMKNYDEKGMLIGESACTKDLISITDHDFNVVNIISIAAIFVIILLVTKSITLPIILVSVIEFAIFINLGIPYYTNTTLPFIASICISTIQLGATVDYAILMTNRYLKERKNGASKKESIATALKTSFPSIIVSALGFFAATFGVAIYSDIDIISSLCTLMSRGAIISMLAVILVLPSMFMIFDKVIIHTTLGFKKQEVK